MIRRSFFLTGLKRFLLLRSDEGLRSLSGLLPDLPNPLLFLLRSEGVVRAHRFDVRTRFTLDGFTFFDGGFGNARLLPARFLMSSGGGPASSPNLRQ